MAIQTALVSVSDKSWLLPFAKGLVQRGVTILSTGGTYRALKDAGVEVATVGSYTGTPETREGTGKSYTGSPEVMEGRVKTLHPRVHGGILMRGPRDMDDLALLGGRPIDL